MWVIARLMRNLETLGHEYFFLRDDGNWSREENARLFDDEQSARKEIDELKLEYPEYSLRLLRRY